MANFTAVEWLITTIRHSKNLNLDEALQEALRMEKEQILDAYVEGDEGEYDNAQTYFEQTYREI
jgi:type IV secretory pathway ATPase VirB11/archaellum biosynthesis ATPase